MTGQNLGGGGGATSPSFPYWADDFSADRTGQYVSGTDAYGQSYPGAFAVSGGQLGIAPAQPSGLRLLLVPDYSVSKPRVDVKVAVAGDLTSGGTVVIPLLWLDASNFIYCRQDGSNMIIQKRLNGSETNLATPAAAMSPGATAWFSAVINGETIRFRRWNSDPATLPPTGPSFEATAGMPTEFISRSGLTGVGVTIDSTLRTTKLDDLKVGVA